HDGNKQNFEVKPKTEVVDIPDVVFEFLCPADGISAVHLSPAGDAWSHVMAARLFSRVEGDVFQEQGAWSHERHVAAEHVDQLRDFIQRCLPDNLAYGGKPIIVRQQVSLRVAVVVHRFEFDHPDGLEVLSRTQLHKKG